MVPCVRKFCLLRSLGQSAVFCGDPHLQIIQVQDLEAARLVGSDPHGGGERRRRLGLRGFVLLGFMPGNPRLLISILNPQSALHGDHELDDLALYSVVIWALSPRSRNQVSLIDRYRLFRHMSLPYPDLYAAATAIMQVNCSMFQVMIFFKTDQHCGELSSHLSGLFEIRQISLSEALMSDQEDAKRAERSITFSTVEAHSAQVCFAGLPRYASILLVTRCIFASEQGFPNLTRGTRPYWSLEQGAIGSDQTLPDARVFEIDLYMEGFLCQQSTPFGTRPSEWSYLSLYHPLPALLVEHHARGQILDAEIGTVLVITVMAENRQSIVQVVLYLDPTAEGTRIDVHVLTAKHWRLQRPASEPRRLLMQLVEKELHIESQHHDCAKSCTVRNKKNLTHVLASYSTESGESLDIIEGTLWNISGKGWKGTLVE